MLYDPKWQKPKIELADWQKLLLDAASILEQRGHTKRRLCDDEGRVCLIGALNVAASGHHLRASPARSAAIAALARHLGFFKSDAGPTLVGWNNSDERTIHDVTAAMREAAGGL